MNDSRNVCSRAHTRFLSRSRDEVAFAQREMKRCLIVRLEQSDMCEEETDFDGPFWFNEQGWFLDDVKGGELDPKDW